MAASDTKQARKPRASLKAKVQPKKKAVDRPYNHYNLFFILERELYVQSRGVATQMSMRKTNPDSEFLNLGIPPLPPRYASITLPEDWYDHVNSRSAKRVHRKTHGQAGFSEIAKIVAASWKDPDEASVKFVKTVAEKVMERRNFLRSSPSTQGEGQRLPVVVSQTAATANKVKTNPQTQEQSPQRQHRAASRGYFMENCDVVATRNALSPQSMMDNTHHHAMIMAQPTVPASVKAVQPVPPTLTANTNMFSASRNQPHCSALSQTQPPLCYPEVPPLMSAAERAMHEINLRRANDIEMEIRRNEMEIRLAMNNISRLRRANESIRHLNVPMMNSRINNTNTVHTTTAAHHFDHNDGIQGRIVSPHEHHIKPEEVFSRGAPSKIIKIDELKIVRSIYHETLNRGQSTLKSGTMQTSMPQDALNRTDCRSEQEADDFLSNLYGVRGEALGKLKRAMF